MDQGTFVDRVRVHVRDAAVGSVASLLDGPPGRRPGADLLEQSAWYTRLTPESKECLRRRYVSASGEETPLAGPDAGILHELL